VLSTGYYWADEIKEHQLGRDGKRRKSSRFSVGKCERRSLGRPKCKWEDNIKVDLKEIAVEDV